MQAIQETALNVQIRRVFEGAEVVVNGIVHGVDQAEALIGRLSGGLIEYKGAPAVVDADVIDVVAVEVPEVKAKEFLKVGTRVIFGPDTKYAKPGSLGTITSVDVGDDTCTYMARQDGEIRDWWHCNRHISVLDAEAASKVFPVGTRVRLHEDYSDYVEKGQLGTVANRHDGTSVRGNSIRVHFDKDGFWNPPFASLELYTDPVVAAEPVAEPVAVETPAVTFKVGDKVRVVRKVDSFKDGWGACWAYPMDALVNDGRTYEVTRVNPTYGYHVANWNFPASALELVAEEPREIQVGDRVVYVDEASSGPFAEVAVGTYGTVKSSACNMYGDFMVDFGGSREVFCLAGEAILCPEFKVGDKVQVVRKIASQTGGWGNSWVGDMDDAVKNGCSYTIKEIHTSGIRLEERGYGWPAAALQLVN